MFWKRKRRSKRLKPIRITLDMAKKMYDKGGEYRYVVSINKNIPHTLCKVYKEAVEVCLLNADSLVIIDLMDMSIARQKGENRYAFQEKS